MTGRLRDIDQTTDEDNFIRLLDLLMRFIVYKRRQRYKQRQTNNET